MRPIPTGGKDTDRGYKIQGYTERPYGRPCILYPPVPVLVATDWNGSGCGLRGGRSDRRGEVSERWGVAA